jgi:hypothetical protein
MVVSASAMRSAFSDGTATYKAAGQKGSFVPTIGTVVTNISALERRGTEAMLTFKYDYNDENLGKQIR